MRATTMRTTKIRSVENKDLADKKSSSVFLAPDRLAFLRTATPRTRALKPLTFRDSFHLILAFLFVYIVASDFHPLWMLEPAPGAPLEMKNEMSLLAARKSSLPSLDKITQFLSEKIQSLAPAAKVSSVCSPGKEHLFPELRYAAPIDKVRLRPRAHAPPAGSRSC